MTDRSLKRVPVVAGLAFIERVRGLAQTFTAELACERDHQYFMHPIAVRVGGEKVGYVAPEIARRYYERLLRHEGGVVTCPGRCASAADHATSGVETLLDFRGLPVAPAE